MVRWADDSAVSGATRHLYDYRVHFERDQSTRSMKLPLEKYSGDADAVVGSWALLEGSTVEQGGGPCIEELRRAFVERGGQSRRT